jgi:glutamate synthase (NADPH/NADH) small chain
VNNIIPDWNDLVYRGKWQQAIEVLHSTNNFPEFTGRICPAPCEAACTLNINADAGRHQVDRARHHRQGRRERLGGAAAGGEEDRQEGRRRRLRPGRPGRRAATGARRPRVTVFEKNDRIGGLLRYGIPDFKLDKRLIDWRMAQMEGRGRQVRHRRAMVGAAALPGRASSTTRRRRQRRNS